MSVFNIGDKLRLKAERKANHPEAFHGRLTVDSTSLGNSYVGVVAEDGKIAGFFESELEADGFRVGDRVEFTDDYFGKARVGDQAVVTATFFDPKHSDDDLVDIRLDDGRKMGAYVWRLKHVPAPVAIEAEEQEPEAQPVTYRIYVNNQIGKTEYPSLESAKAAALLHGNDGEEFSIWEVVKVADYRVKVTKGLETVDAAD